MQENKSIQIHYKLYKQSLLELLLKITNIRTDDQHIYKAVTNKKNQQNQDLNNCSQTKVLQRNITQSKVLSK